MTASDIAPINDTEAKLIEQLRDQVNGLDNFTDGTIVRWIRGHNHDAEKCAEALTKHIVFRKAWGLDHILTDWKRPEVLQKYDSVGFVGEDKVGAPVMLTLFGHLDVEGIAKSCTSFEYVKFSLICMEEGVKRCDALAKKTGKPYEQMTVVFDVENLNSSHYSFKPFTNSFLTLSALYQENYPLALKKIFAIKAPSLAHYAYKLLTPLLSEETQQLVELLGEDWREVLFTYISPESFPAFWGGQLTDPDGNPKCITYVPYTSGPVPESYFIDVDAEMSNTSDTTVYAGDKHLVEVNVISPPALLSWKYRTVSEDIGFAIYYDAEGTTETLSDMEPLFPYIRLECSMLPVAGSLVCQKPGRYVVEFDNYYSWFSAKELSCLIDLKEI